MRTTYKKARMVALVGLIIMAITLVEVQASDYKGHWAEKSLVKWIDLGILSGYADGEVKPNNILTRAEFATMLTKTFGLQYVAHGVTYKGVDEGKWYTEAMKYTISAGMLRSRSACYAPTAAITREEAAYAVAKALEINEVGTTVFHDQKDFSEWAYVVTKLADLGYISGYRDGSFNPGGKLTRAQAVTILDNAVTTLINQSGTIHHVGSGNVVVNVGDVILKDVIIEGNLYLAQGSAKGEVTLDNVIVRGKIIIQHDNQVRQLEGKKFKYITKSELKNN